MKVRHGDVKIKQIESIPNNAQLQEGRTVLVEGESTGHAHRLANAKAGMIYMLGTQLYLRMLQHNDIVHEEHDTITLPPGDYEISIQRELDPFGHIRTVVD